MTTAEENRAAYMATVSELRLLAKRAPYVTEDWVLTVASMAPDEMRRRLIRSYDWSGHFHHSLDGIPQIKGLPGSGIDGCRSHKEVRAVVTGLLDQIELLKARLADSVRNTPPDDQGDQPSRDTPR